MTVDPGQAQASYEFGPFRLDAVERSFRRGDESVPLTPKAFDLLLLLVQNKGHLLEKDEIMTRLWPETFVEEANLSNNISLLRKALNDDIGRHRYIETVPRRGYRFIAEVSRVQGDDDGRYDQDGSRDDILLQHDLVPDETRIITTHRYRSVGIFLAVLFLVGGVGYVTYRMWPKTSGVTDSTPSGEIKSIAVLPFKSLDAEHRNQTLELGMTDTLITRLTNLREVVVRPTSAVREYVALEQDPIAAGREQNVDAVLDGTIQKSGDRIRVTARLLRTADGITLWAETFDTEFTDVFQVQDSISERVAAQLAFKLSPEEHERLTKHYTSSTEAYQLYLKGRYFLNASTEEDFRKSIDYFNRALALDPAYALAYAGLADSYVQLGFFGSMPMNESHPKARAAALRSLEIDDQLGEAHASLAIILTTYYWDWGAAEEQFKRAIELNPNYAMTHNWYSQYLAYMGRSDVAIQEARRAQEIDPLSLFANSNIGLVLFLARQYDEAIYASQKTLEFDPDFAVAHMVMGLAYLEKKMYSESISELRKARDHPDSLGLLAYALGVSGRKDEARKILNQLQLLSKDRYVASAPVAIAYIGLGEKDRAFDWLEKALDERLWEMGTLKVNPVFDPLRADERFESLLSRVHLD